MPAKRPPKPAPAHADRHAHMLRLADLRVTDVRLAVLAAMEHAPSALNAQQLYDAVAASPAATSAPRSGKPKPPDRVTVYRTLNSLVDAGLAHRVDPGDRVFRFSLTDHARCSDHHHVHEHPHFVCDSCGKVECLEGAEVVIKSKDRPADARTLSQRDAVLHGTCGTCDHPAAAAPRH